MCVCMFGTWCVIFIFLLLSPFISLKFGLSVCRLPVAGRVLFWRHGTVFLYRTVLFLFFFSVQFLTSLLTFFSLFSVMVSSMTCWRGVMCVCVCPCLILMVCPRMGYVRCMKNARLGWFCIIDGNVKHTKAVFLFLFLLLLLLLL